MFAHYDFGPREYLHVSVQNLEVVKGFESEDHLDEQTPELVLRESGMMLDVVVYFAHEVAALREFHDDAQRTGAVLEEGLLVCDDVRVTIISNAGLT